MTPATRERLSVFGLCVAWGIPIVMAFVAGMAFGTGTRTIVDYMAGALCVVGAVAMVILNIKDIRDED